MLNNFIVLYALLHSTSVSVLYEYLLEHYVSLVRIYSTISIFMNGMI